MITSVLRDLRHHLPSGMPLPDAAWLHRHRAIIVLLWLHAIGIAAFTVLSGESIGHAAFEGE